MYVIHAVHNDVDFKAQTELQVAESGGRGRRLVYPGSCRGTPASYWQIHMLTILQRRAVCTELNDCERQSRGSYGAMSNSPVTDYSQCVPGASTAPATTTTSTTTAPTSVPSGIDEANFWFSLSVYASFSVEQYSPQWFVTAETHIPKQGSRRTELSLHPETRLATLLTPYALNLCTNVYACILKSANRAIPQSGAPTGSTSIPWCTTSLSS